MKAYFKRNDLFKELEVVEGSNYLQLVSELGFDFCLGHLYSDYENAKSGTSCKCNWEENIRCNECSSEFERYIAVQSILDSLSCPRADIVVFRQGFSPDEFYGIPSVCIKHFTEDNDSNLGDELMSKLIVHTEEFASFFAFLAIEDDNGNIEVLKGSHQELIDEESFAKNGNFFCFVERQSLSSLLA